MGDDVITTIADEIQQTQPFKSKHQETRIALLRTSALLLNQTDAVLKPHDITVQQYNVLRILKGAAAPMPLMDIGERLVQPTPGISRMIARLERDGLVAREKNPDDGRGVLVALTADGHARLESSSPIVDNLDNVQTSCLNAKELTTLLGYLDRIRHSIRQASAE